MDAWPRLSDVCDAYGPCGDFQMKKRLTLGFGSQGSFRFGFCPQPEKLGVHLQ